MEPYRHRNYQSITPLKKMLSASFAASDLGLDALIFEKEPVILRHGMSVQEKQLEIPVQSILSNITITEGIQIIENQVDKFNYNEIIIPVLYIKSAIKGEYNGMFEALVKPKILQDHTSKQQQTGINGVPVLDRYEDRMPIPNKPVTLEKIKANPNFKNELSPELYFCIRSLQPIQTVHIGKKSYMSDDDESMTCSMTPLNCKDVMNAQIDLNALDSKSFSELCIFYAGKRLVDFMYNK